MPSELEASPFPSLLLLYHMQFVTTPREYGVPDFTQQLWEGLAARPSASPSLAPQEKKGGTYSTR